MTKGRALVYKFFNLPYHRQLEILKNMSLVTTEEVMKAPDIVLFETAFRRAKEQNLIPQLELEINK